MKYLAFILFSLSILSCTTETRNPPSYTFEIAFDTLYSADTLLTGRLLLLLSNNDDDEPRFQIEDGPNTQIVYGMDLVGHDPGESVLFDQKAFGFPIEKLQDVPQDEYYVQVLFNRYEEYTPEHGNTILLPPDMGEGQQWNLKPGNLLSEPKKISLKKGGVYQLEVSTVIPPIDPPADTKYIKHITMQSDMLTQFWGRQVDLGAIVLLPDGFEEHPEAKYPLMVFHGHFPHTLTGFREEPPDPNLKPTYNERFKISGYNQLRQEEAYAFYKKWVSDTFPRYIVMLVQHANPFYDDSYAVNSANLGPYGDAITYELIPHVERMFRGLGQPWARFLYGGSTGGWEALAAQVFYPEEYNGCFAACPDPIDFRAYCLVNLYEDDNAYYYDSDYRLMLKPGQRDYLGQVSATVRGFNWKELALGTHSRSGQQFDIWEAVYSPVGKDGYPERIWDKYTGVINKEVAEYWKENYDLRYILERDWEKLGKSLEGKIHIYCGDMDNYYLNNAVYLMEEFLENTKNPYYGGEVDYGDRAEHCWNGDHDNPNYISRLRYNTMYLPKILKRIEESAPPGADLTSWRY